MKKYVILARLPPLQDGKATGFPSRLGSGFPLKAGMTNYLAGMTNYLRMTSYAGITSYAGMTTLQKIMTYYKRER